MAPQTGPVFPQVDISNFDKRKDEVSQELGKAARDIGFFYVVGALQTSWSQYFIYVPLI